MAEPPTAKNKKQASNNMSTPDNKTQPRTVPTAEPKRTSIAVGMLKFVSPQDGVGFSVASALTPYGGTGNKQGRPKFEITFLPWLRSFRVQYNPLDGEPQAGFIPESRVMFWTPVDPASIPTQ